MKAIQGFWVSLLLVLPIAVQPAVARSPEQDIVAVVSTQSLSDSESVPGLLTGRRIMDRLHDALELVHGGVPDAARAGLGGLESDLRRLSAGDALESPLPASYRKNGELWLPVQAQRLRVWLDAPDLRPRPSPGMAGGKPANLPARARRIDWLPVGLTAQRVAGALFLLSGGSAGLARAERLLQAALRGAQPNLVLEHRPLILAYYRVEAALAAAPHWGKAVRDRLRHAAEALDAKPGNVKLAERLQAQANRLTPDPRALQELALSLRQHVVLSAGVSTGGQSGGYTS